MSEPVTLTIGVGLLFLWFSTLLYFQLFKPDTTEKLNEFGKPTDDYLGENYDGTMMLVIFLGFIMSCCMLLFVLYGWIRVAIQ